MLRKFSVFAVAAGLMTSAAHATLLINVDGTVMVNKGQGFVEIPDITDVKAGDRVMVRGDGTAQIDYGDGCVVEVKTNESAVVAENSTCDRGALYSTSTSAGGPGSLKDKPGVEAQQPAPDDRFAIVGGLVAAGAAGVALHEYELHDNDKDKPASP